MNKAVTVLHCDRFCIIIANCPSPHTNPTNSALSQSLFVLQSSVCLYGFAFALSPSTAKFSNTKIRHLSKQRILYIQFSALVKMVSGSKAMMLQQRPHHPTATAFPHYPLLCTIFLPYERSVGFASVQSLWAFNFGHPCPSLVKGSWIDGNAQTVALLLSACDMPTLFILQAFLPSRRRDCTPSAPSIRFSALSPSLFVGERACPSR